MAGLYLYFGCWAEAHETAQDIATPEGSYWHAIVHRQEPDAWNSGYWFRQVGAHAIYPALRDAAAEIGSTRGAPVEARSVCRALRARAPEPRLGSSSGRRARCSAPSGSCCSTIARAYEAFPRKAQPGKPPHKPAKAPGDLWIYALLTAAVFAAYWQVLHFGFVNYDDPVYVADNPM
jgi:hypothetical protein